MNVGERLMLGTDTGFRLCSGTVDLLDAHVAHMESATGLRRPGRAAMYLLSDAQLVSRFCNQSERGKCYNPRVRAAFAHVPSLDRDAMAHELVHDFADHTRLGSAPPLLAEGMAVLFSTDACTLPMASNTSAAFLLDIAPGSSLQTSEYSLGALYLQWLFERYGLDQVLDFLSGLNAESSLSIIRTRFEASFGEAFDIASAQFEVARPRFASRFARCDGIAPLSADGAPNLSTDFACDSHTTVDDFSFHAHWLRTSRILALDADATYDISCDADVELVVSACDCAQDDQSPGHLIHPDSKRLQLAAGRYRIDVLLPVGAVAGERRAELHPVSAMAATSSD
jgi:hypothetical protein